MNLAERPIANIASYISPQLLASEMYVELDGCLAEVFPFGRVQRGSVVLFEGSFNSGVTSVLLEFLSSGGMRKMWTALVGFENLGFLAARERGVDLGRVVSVPDPGRNLAQVIAVLLDAFSVVVIDNPRLISSSQARNLVSRVRSSKSIVAVVQQHASAKNMAAKGVWPGSCDYLVRSSISGFSGLGRGGGFIKERQVSISLEGRHFGGAVKSAIVRI